MTSPAASIACWTCRTLAWKGGTTTPDGEVTGQPVGTMTTPDGRGIQVDADVILSAFADASCPRKGVGCPYTTTAKAEAAKATPATGGDLATVRTELTTLATSTAATLATLAAKLAELTTRVDTLTTRQPRLAQAAHPLPALSVGTRDVALTWGMTFAAAPAGVVAIIDDLPALSEGKVAVTVKTLTPTGVTITITTTAVISAGGRVRVLATGWPA